MYPSSQPKRLLLVAVGTCGVLTVSNASPLVDRIATYTVPLADREFGVSSFHVAPLDDMVRRDLPPSPYVIAFNKHIWSLIRPTGEQSRLGSE